MLWRRLCLAQESEVRREIGGVAVFVAHYRCPSARILVAAARLAFLFCPWGNTKSHKIHRTRKGLRLSNTVAVSCVRPLFSSFHFVLAPRFAAWRTACCPSKRTRTEQAPLPPAQLVSSPSPRTPQPPSLLNSPLATCHFPSNRLLLLAVQQRAASVSRIPASSTFHTSRSSSPQRPAPSLDLSLTSFVIRPDPPLPPRDFRCH